MEEIKRKIIEEFNHGVSRSFNMSSIHEWAETPTSKIIFSHKFLDYCKANTCGNYNKSWTCPPACKSLEEQKNIILTYDKLFVFTTKHNLEDSFDYDGMTKGQNLHTLITAQLKEKLPETLVYGAGKCPVCSTCSFPSPCPFPEKMIGSIEAAGIDVTELSKAAGINYNNGPDTVTFFSVIFCQKQIRLEDLDLPNAV